MTDVIKLKKYDMALEDGKVTYYAIPLKGERIRMPEAFKGMYDEDHLAIKKRIFLRPELYDLDSEEAYIPLRTAPVVE